MPPRPPASRSPDENGVQSSFLPGVGVRDSRGRPPARQAEAVVRLRRAGSVGRSVRGVVGKFRPARSTRRRSAVAEVRPSVEGPSKRVVFCRLADGRPAWSGHRAEIAQLVEHATENRGVASSILALGTTASVVAVSSGSGSVGRASPCQGEGRGFESRLPLHFLVRRSLRRLGPAGSPPRDDAPVPLRLVVGQRTLDPLAEVRILEGQPPRPELRRIAGTEPRPDPLPRRRRLRGDVPKWLRGRSAKPLFSGSNPLVASTYARIRPRATLGLTFDRSLTATVGGQLASSGLLGTPRPSAQVSHISRAPS